MSDRLFQLSYLINELSSSNETQNLSKRELISELEVSRLSQLLLLINLIVIAQIIN